jgi:hypothetical protein
VRASKDMRALSKYRGRRANRGKTVIFIGESDGLLTALAVAREQGFAPVEVPHPALICAVADRSILAGRCTKAEAAILQRVRAFGVPCLTPDQALLWLAELESRDLTSA